MFSALKCFFNLIKYNSFKIYVGIRYKGLPLWLSSKESACSAEASGSIPGWGRSPGGGHGSILQYSCLENSVDRETWWATVHRVTELGKTKVTEQGHIRHKI